MYNVHAKIEDIFNNILSYIAMPWIISEDQGLYVDGFFFKNIQSLNDQLVFKLDVALR